MSFELRVRQPPPDLGSDDWIGPREDSWQDRYINYDQTTREVNENARLFQSFADRRHLVLQGSTRLSTSFWTLAREGRSVKASKLSGRV